MQCENFLEHISQVFGYDPEYLFGILDLKSFSQEVFEFIIGVFKLLVEVAPGQVVLIEEIHHDVHGALDVVSPRLVVAAAGVETCKKKIAGELLDEFFLEVLAVFF